MNRAINPKWILLAIAALLLSACKEEEVCVKQGEFTLIAVPEEPGFSYTNGKNESVIEAMDINQDGRVDFLRYNSFDNTGQNVLQVEDCNLDGTIDVKWHLPNAPPSQSWHEVWHQGTWRKVHKGGFIIAGEEMVPVKMINGCLRAASNK